MISKNLYLEVDPCNFKVRQVAKVPIVGAELCFNRTHPGRKELLDKCRANPKNKSVFEQLDKEDAFWRTQYRQLLVRQLNCLIDRNTNILAANERNQLKDTIRRIMK